MSQTIKSGATGLWALLAGRKTYLVALLGALYFFGGDQGWWKVSAEVLGMLNLLGLAALRAGLGSAAASPQVTISGSTTATGQSSVKP